MIYKKNIIYLVLVISLTLNVIFIYNYYNDIINNRIIIHDTNKGITEIKQSNQIDKNIIENILHKYPKIDFKLFDDVMAYYIKLTKIQKSQFMEDLSKLEISWVGKIYDITNIDGVNTIVVLRNSCDVKQVIYISAINENIDLFKFNKENWIIFKGNISEKCYEISDSYIFYFYAKDIILTK